MKLDEKQITTWQAVKVAYWSYFNSKKYETLRSMMDKGYSFQYAYEVINPSKF